MLFFLVSPHSADRKENRLSKVASGSLGFLMPSRQFAAKSPSGHLEKEEILEDTTYLRNDIDMFLSISASPTVYWFTMIFLNNFLKKDSNKERHFHLAMAGALFG